MPPSQSSKLSPAAVIGPGRVGLALAIFLDRIGTEITVGTRSERGRQRVEAAGLTVAGPTEATRGASLVILAVPDDELPSLVTALAADGAFAAGQVVIHTAGVDGPGLLAPAAAAGARTAACHPVQIFNDDLEATLGRLPGTVWGSPATRRARRSWPPWAAGRWTCPSRAGSATTPPWCWRPTAAPPCPPPPPTSCGPAA